MVALAAGVKLWQVAGKCMCRLVLTGDARETVHSQGPPTCCGQSNSEVSSTREWWEQRLLRTLHL